jgi:hypothetical protein
MRGREPERQRQQDQVAFLAGRLGGKQPARRQVQREAEQREVQSVDLRDQRLAPAFARQGSEQAAAGRQRGDAPAGRCRRRCCEAALQRQREEEHADGRAQRREQVQPPGDAAERQLREQVAQHHVQRVAGLVRHAGDEGRRDQLAAVLEGHARRQGGDVDGKGADRGQQRGESVAASHGRAS